MTGNSNHKKLMKYITDHPDRWVVKKGHVALICAPYKEIAIRQTMESDAVVFFDPRHGVDYWHRLDGPAYIKNNGEKHCFLFDKEISEDSFWKHPAVLNYMVINLIKEVLEEDNNSDITKTENTGDKNG